MDFNIKEYYKACGGVFLGTEEQKIKRLNSFEKSGKWIAEGKRDGIWFVLNGLNGNTTGHARSGKQREHGLPHIGDGNIIIGELSESTETALERKSIIGHSFIDVFDIHTLDYEDVTGYSLMDRKKILKEWVNSLNDFEKQYFLYVTSHETGFEELYNNQKEGIVLKQKNGLYKSYDWDWIKVKKEDTWDFVIMDYIVSTAESKLSTPTAKSIIVGQYVDGILKSMTKVPISISLGIDIVKDFNKYKDRVVEVIGFSRTKTGSVRSPRFVRLRDDKLKEDCVFKLNK